MNNVMNLENEELELEEENENVYYTNRQKSIINSVIKTITENFNNN